MIFSGSPGAIYLKIYGIFHPLAEHNLILPYFFRLGHGSISLVRGCRVGILCDTIGLDKLDNYYRIDIISPAKY
jgi:hypothetical protein